MDISYNDLRVKEIINLSDGSKMGHVIDVIFDSDAGRIKGFVAPGEKHIFKKSEEIFIPLEKVRRIGDDVILIRFEIPDLKINRYGVREKRQRYNSTKIYKTAPTDKDGSFIRYRKLDNKKYK